MLSHEEIGRIFKGRLPPDLYADEVAYFEDPNGTDKFLSHSAMGNLVYVAAECVGKDVARAQAIINLADELWASGDERAMNVVDVSFIENFDNLRIDQTKALHRLMKPHMRKKLEDELARFQIDWAR